VIDVRDGQVPSSYSTGYGTGYTSGTATGYTTGATAGYAAGSTGGDDYATADYGQTGATGYPVAGETTTTYTTGGTTEGYPDQYGTGGTTEGYRGQYGAGGTAEGDPTYGVERTSDPNLGPTSGTLSGDPLSDRDRDLGVDEPVAPEYGGQGVGQPGPNAPTGSPESDTDYGTEYGTGPKYGDGSEERPR
jgi:hypothetical protein